jgi:hypothetical protein
MTVKLTNQGSWADVNVSEILLDGKKMDLRIDAHITEAALERTIEGASTVALTVYDMHRDILTSGILANRINIQVDMFKFSLVQVSKANESLTLTFEDWLVSQLRRNKKPIKAKRGNITRAEFAKRLVSEVHGANFVCPELHKVQPIAKSSELDSTAEKDFKKEYGFAHSATIMIKRTKAEKEQLKNADTILQVGKSLSADTFTQATAIATAIQESSLRNLFGGDRDSIGLFQQRPSQGWGTRAEISDPATAAHKFFERAVPNRKKYPNYPMGRLAATVQNPVVSRTPGSKYEHDVAQWNAEADAIYNAWSGTSEFPDTLGTDTKVYEFHRGGAGHKGEDSWQCLQRLADEVKWRCFCIGMTVYFMPDRDLYKARPIDTVSEADVDIDWINFDYDLGKDVTHAEVQCHQRRWVAPPGACVMIEDMGPVNGRWIVSDISRSLYNDDTTISLIKPVKPLPEPIGSGTASNTGLKTSGGLSGEFAVRIGRQWVTPKYAKSAGYVYGAGHGYTYDQILNGNPQPPFDCSSFTRICWVKGGHIDIGGDTYGQMAHAKATSWQQGHGIAPPGGWLAGDLLFPHEKHVALATGEGTTIQAKGSAYGIVEEPVYTSVLFWARPEPAL